MTVLENVMVGAHSTVVGQLRHGPAAARHARRGTPSCAVAAYELLEPLGLAEVAFQPAAGLPFGTLKRVELARALAGDPKLLMLDEPAGGLTHARGRRARPS